MPLSNVSPSLYKIDEIKGNKVSVRLRGNVIATTSQDSITGDNETMYQYDEVMVEIKNRDNLEVYIEANFDSLFNLGVEQKETKEKLKNTQRQIKELINEGKQIDLNNEIKDNIRLLEEQTRVDLLQAESERNVAEKIDQGLITATNFNELSITEQELVKLVLFKRYSPNQDTIPKALSSAEFMFASLYKFLEKTIDRSKLTTEENNYFDSLMQVINLNNMPINDTTDWRFQYLSNVFTNVQNNRQEYFNAKLNVTGQL